MLCTRVMLTVNSLRFTPVPPGFRDRIFAIAEIYAKSSKRRDIFYADSGRVAPCDVITTNMSTAKRSRLPTNITVKDETISPIQVVFRKKKNPNKTQQNQAFLATTITKKILYRL